jgi:hypothetical protein
VNKGVRGMPRLPEAKKDVPSCENPRGPARRVDPWVSEWGNPPRVIGVFRKEGEPAELKHLSRQRRRKQE